MRWYSSSPSRRCAFCIGIFLLPDRRFGQLQRSSIGVNQPQLVGPPLAVMDNLVFLVMLNECGDILDRSPARNVTVVSLAEDAIQQTCRAEQSNMASMQRRDRAPGGHVFVWSEKRRHLLPRAGVRQQVF